MSSTEPTLDAAQDNRAARKHAAILRAAGEVFLRHGYVGASMDEIAAGAAVSKQTVYKHFADKETLFGELITSTVRANGNAAADEPILDGDEPFEEHLRAFARHLLHGVMQPRVLGLRRLVIAEASRFPALGALFYDLGLATTIERLSVAFAQLDNEGLLDIDDARLAAEHFVWLVLSIPLNRAMLLGDEHGVNDAELDRYADAGTRVFVAAYGGSAHPEGSVKRRRSRTAR